ncbi:Hypothetical protein MSYG_3148 [Malassezia sympodialis ATCC 42132]|uniref:Uncharacterized protein n=1 Tax=Malassezia sympodialis (strain ATCC 42132) TaxID=1230383 RepID=A0A1M8A8M3_MALS4|nr:Hypothetical protein MSYG_3148 [Malassezia sympodialis ATCC 42132]
MSVMALNPLDKVAIQPYERPVRPLLRTPQIGALKSPWETFEREANGIFTHILVPTMRVVGALTLLAVLTVVLKEGTKACAYVGPQGTCATDPADGPLRQWPSS